MKKIILIITLLIGIVSYGQGYSKATGQKEITDDYTLVSSDNGKTIWLNKATTFTITVDNIPVNNFECYFYNIGVGAVTFANGTGILDTPDGTQLQTDKTCIIIKKERNNDYKLKGDLL